MSRNAKPPAAVDPKAVSPKWNIITHVAVYFAAFLYILPLLYMLKFATVSEREAQQPTLELWNFDPQFSNFSDAWTKSSFGSYMWNSFIVAILGTILTVTISVVAGYTFAKMEFKGKSGIFGLFLATVMIPAGVLLIPLYVFVVKLGWVDTYTGMIVPIAFGAFGTFLLRQFFRSIPGELEQAAFMDGASRFKSLILVMLPVAKPAVAVLTIFTFINYWNNFLWPFIIASADKYTVPVGLQEIATSDVVEWNTVMASSTLAMLPTVLIVILLSRHLVRGIAMSGFGGR